MVGGRRGKVSKIGRSDILCAQGRGAFECDGGVKKKRTGGAQSSRARGGGETACLGKGKAVCPGDTGEGGSFGGGVNVLGKGKKGALNSKEGFAAV